MATYRIFPSTNGPSSANGYSGNFLSAVVFTATEGGCWFEGYYWWVCGSGQSTSAVKCALWSQSGGASAEQTKGGAVVTGSVVTSGTLTAGAWNYIPLSTPVQISPYDTLIAAVGCNGSFPDTNGFWASHNGITNGPLFAFGEGLAQSGTSYFAGGNANPDSVPQGVFSTAGSDPSVTLPGSSSNTDNFWVDVQISDTAPSGYTGSYRLWPNRYAADDLVQGDAANDYVLGTEVRLSASCTVNNIWFYSPPNASQLFPTAVDIWSVNSGGVTGTNVFTESSPTWYKPSGTTASGTSWPGGWIYTPISATTLGAGTYRVSVFNSSGTTHAWSTKRYGYWGVYTAGSTAYSTADVGINGITNGPIYAPNTANASTCYSFNPVTGTPTEPGQAPFAETGTDTYPNQYIGTNSTAGDLFENFWVDLEVTLIPVITGTASVAIGNVGVSATGQLEAGGVSVAIGSVAISATSQRTTFGTSSVAVGATSVSAIGQLEAGPVNVAIGSVVISATGHRTTFGTSSVAVGNVGISAAGLLPGGASIALGSISISATGQRTTFGVSGVALGGVAVAAVGLLKSGPVEIAVGPVGVSAAGQRTTLATPDIALGGVSVSCTGGPISSGPTIVNGSGEIAVAPIAISARGVSWDPANTVSVVFEAITFAVVSFPPIAKISFNIVEGVV